MPILNTRVDADLAERWHKLCAAKGESSSEVLRQAITAFVERDLSAKREGASASPTLQQAVSAFRAQPSPEDLSTLPDWPPHSAYGARLKKDKASK
jgi:hypothetical protein